MIEQQKQTDTEKSLSSHLWDLSKVAITAVGLLSTAGCSADKLDEAAMLTRPQPTPNDVVDNPNLWAEKEVTMFGDLTFRPEEIRITVMSTTQPKTLLDNHTPLKSTPARVAVELHYDLHPKGEGGAVFPVVSSFEETGSKIELDMKSLREHIPSNTQAVSGKIHLSLETKAPYLEHQGSLPHLGK
jgi:hypothetical protein